MDEARALLPAPDPVAAGCVGACLSCSEADEWRATDPGRYCGWVAAVDAGAQTAPVAGAWKLWGPASKNVLWSTGLDFERIMALVRTASLTMRGNGLTADEALAARDMYERARTLAAAWDTDPEVWYHAPEISPVGLAKLARVAWATAHALAIRTLNDPAVRAGLWRTLARTLTTAETEAGIHTGIAEQALEAATLYAEVEAMRESGTSHFDACRAGAARACAARALERARAAHTASQALVCAARVQQLQDEFDRVHAVAERVEGGTGRVFDASLLCACVPLPHV